MKTIKNLTQEDKEILKVPCEQVAPNSIVTISYLRQIDKICNVIEQSKEDLELEDADYHYLKNKFVAFTGWNSSLEARRAILAVSAKLNIVEE